MKDQLSRQRDWIELYRFHPRVTDRGKVISVGDGIIWISGIPRTALDDVLTLDDGSVAMVFHLGQDLVGAILLQESASLTAGVMVQRTVGRLQIPVGDELLGRVVDPLGRALDGGPAPSCSHFRDADVKSPPIIARDFVNRSLLTGNKIVDTMIPIGKGQRQLLIGDNGLGKSSLAIDAIINQKDKSLFCVYVLIGQKRSSVLSTIQTLREAGALEHCVIVTAEASSLPGLQYLAPFSGCAIAEHWMSAGRDTLIVYDDLSAHADCYRELSLLLRHPPGREAYPADIFYLHARLLERSTCLSRQEGGGSMTALPIVETKEGEIASYIPTNLISITDGQIYFDASLFDSGFLPAIDITRSVSRVGGKAQPQDIKDEASRMKLDYLQFLELEVFTRFGARLEASMQKKIDQGRVLREILKQDRLSPLTEDQQLTWLKAFNQGVFDGLSNHALKEKMAEVLGKASHE
jgi:F-type H+-transporting ATPase subunit alpha